MPNDVGLRRCRCGRLVLLKQLLEVKTAESSDLPRIDLVPEEALIHCLEEAESEEIEVAARLGCWRYLNHPYRRKYREHRDAEEAASKTAWEAANPDRRTWWEKICGRERLAYRRPENSPFTCPVFEPSDLQCRNMERLTEIFISHGGGSPYGFGALTLAELLREQGRFDEARRIMLTINMEDEGMTGEVISKLIEERERAPVRYKM